MISAVLHWLAASAPTPRWAVCLGALAGFVVAVEVAVVVTLWVENQRFERDEDTP